MTRAPMVQNPLHGVESNVFGNTRYHYWITPNPLHGVERTLTTETSNNAGHPRNPLHGVESRQARPWDLHWICWIRIHYMELKGSKDLLQPLRFHITENPLHGVERFDSTYSGSREDIESITWSWKVTVNLGVVRSTLNAESITWSWKITLVEKP